MKSLKNILILLFMVAAGCAGERAIQNLSVSKAEVQRYYESGEYNKELKETVDKAFNELGKIEVDASTTIIFDVDETVLDNYPHIKEVDFGYVIPLWDQWIDEKKAPVIGEVKRIYDFFTEKGARIVFLTGRKYYQYQATFDNLKSAGYTTFDTLITKSQQYSGVKASEYKSDIRTKLSERGYVIKVSVGDQWSDLEGPYSGIKVKIPNYLYWID
jgi:acid phosphatase